MNAWILSIKAWFLGIFTKRHVILNKDDFVKFEDAIKKKKPNSLEELKAILAIYTSAKWYYRRPALRVEGSGYTITICFRYWPVKLCWEIYPPLYID